MSRIKIYKAHADLEIAFGKIGKTFADKIKKEYNLNELFVPNTVASQLLAGHYLGKKVFNFRVRKKGLNKGILEIVD